MWDLFDQGKSYEFGYEPYSLDYQKALDCYMQCAQVICKLHGKKRMREFLAATGIPEQFGKRPALIHPVRLFCNLGLIPHRNCIPDYLAVFHDVLLVFDDRLSVVMERCSPADESISISEIKEELNKQRAYYEKWIVEPDYKCPRFYLDFRHSFC